MASALSGVKVLDVTGLGPAGFVSMTMGDMGAEVIKVDMPPGGGHSGVGDGTAYFPEDKDESARMIACRTANRNKKSIAVNMRNEAGQAIFHKMARTSDVVIESFRPGVMDRMNVGYQSLSQANPRIIYCAVSGYGQTGPYRNYPGHDGNYCAFGGMLGLTGPSAGTPPVFALNIGADMAVAYLNALVGVLLAICARERTGKGQLVDVSMTDGVFGIMAGVPGPMEYPYSGVVPVRGETNSSGNNPYYAVYATKDKKYLSVCSIEPRFWQNMCKSIGRGDLASEQFALSPRREEIVKDLQELFLTKTRDEWFDLLIEADVCVAKVLDIYEAFNDPQLIHREMILNVSHPKFDNIRQPGISIKLSDTPGNVRSLGVPLGTHTTEVLSGLGYSEADIQSLRAQRVIA